MIIISPFTKKSFCIIFLLLVTDLESEYKKCEPEVWSVTIFFSFVLPLAIISAVCYCYYKYLVRKEKIREEQAETTSSLRQRSLTTTNEGADANNQTDVEVVLDTVLNPPPYSKNNTKSKKICFFFVKLK